MKEAKGDPMPLEARVVGARIRALRRRAHLSQSAFAQHLGMRQGPVCNIELGKNLPSAQVLARIAGVLNVTLDEILIGRVTDTGVTPSTPYERTPSPLPALRHPFNTTLYLTSAAYKLDQSPALQAMIESVARDYLALEDICRVPRQARIPLQFFFESDAAGVARLAVQTRTLFGVAQAAVFDHLELFENHGLRAVLLPLPEALPSLACYDARNANLFIFIGDDLTSERQIFLLAYNLGRVLLYNRALLLGEAPLTHEARKDKAARLFAANFLMPAGVVRTSVGQTGVRPDEWDLALLLRLKHRFGVSAEAFNYRLLELGLITATRQSELRAAIKAHYAAHHCSEPGNSRRILSPNGRLGDLLHTALRRAEPEAPEIAARLKKWKVRMP
jgi:Zn-dependent peptidase ImmA (M78 family)/DNA-binding XRE family transcriptional regulator